MIPQRFPWRKPVQRDRFDRWLAGSPAWSPHQHVRAQFSTPTYSLWCGTLETLAVNTIVKEFLRRVSLRSRFYISVYKPLRILSFSLCTTPWSCSHVSSSSFARISGRRSAQNLNPKVPIEVALAALRSMCYTDMERTYLWSVLVSKVLLRQEEI